MEARPQPRRRRRPALSCLECRRRKVKCDRNDPCLRCVATKTQCIFSSLGDRCDPPASRATVAPTNATSNASTHGISKPLPSSRPTTEETVVPASLGSSATPQFIATPNSMAENSPGGQFAKNYDRLGFHDLVNDNDKQSWGLVYNKDSLLESTGSQASRIGLYKTRTMNSSHFISISSKLGTIYDCWCLALASDNEALFANQEMERIAHEIKELSQRCKLLAKSIKTHRPSMFMAWNDFDMAPPSREDCDRLVQQYFLHFESVYRILYRPEFMTQYEEYWSRPEEATVKRRLMLLLVIAAATSIEPQDNAKHVRSRERACQWVYGAQMWLSGPMEKARLSIPGLQIQCLTLLVRQNFNIGGDLLWDSTGSLLQTAMQLGLHRDPKHLPSTTFVEAEIRRRLWTTVLEMSVQSSLDSALPLRISTHDYDTEIPANINDKELQGPSAQQSISPQHTYTDNWTQCALTNSLSTRMEILKRLTNLQEGIEYQHALSLSSELVNALREQGKHFRSFSRDQCPLLHGNLIDYLTRRFLIPLHSKFAAKARTNPLFQYSLTKSIETSLAIVHPESDQSFQALLERGGGPYREGVMAASTVIAIELLAQTEEHCNDGTVIRAREGREFLKRTIQDLVVSASRRIEQQAETSIKAHMFLSTVLAQVSAMEENGSQQMMILQASRDSLDYCLGLLKTQVDEAATGSTHELDIRDIAASGNVDLMLDWDLDFSFLSQSPIIRLS